MKRLISMTVLAAVAFAIHMAGGEAPRNPRFLEWLSAPDGSKVMKLLGELPNMDINKLAPLPIKRYALPEAGVDVMRVKMDETYTVDGVGRDTIQLSGWIAVMHDNPRPAQDEKEIRWETAVSDTEFVGMDLRGESQLFGPVRVTLNPAHRSRGIVGNLKFSIMDAIMLDLAYNQYREAPITRQDIQVPKREVASTSALRGPFASFFQPPEGGMTRDQKAVADVVKALANAISEKRAEKMLVLYDKSPNNVFFSATEGKDIRGAEAYVNSLAKMFADIRTIKVIPNNDMRVLVSGRLAVATLTGMNDVVDNEGRRGSGPWKLTVQLQKTGARWLISHDHFSFGEVASGANIPRAPSGKCIANISANVAMNKLGLQMDAVSPIQWYSEVDTIPPVGHTASVSLFPTRLVSAQREVATLQRGAVNFREVVLHVPLEGHPATLSR